MAITYPLSLPTSPAARTTAFRIETAAADAESPFTYVRQTHLYPGQRWLVQVNLPRMSRVAAAEWQAFFVSLDGKRGTFYLGDWDAETPQGSAGGTPIANSSGSPSINLAGDREFFTTGWPQITVDVLKAGDWIQIGSGASQTLHMVLVDASSDSNGDMTLDIRPPLRADVPNGTAITTSSAKGVFHLPNNDPGWDSDYAIRYGFQFRAVEDL